MVRGSRRWWKKGLGISILPDMILKRMPYNVEVRSLQEPYYRSIGLAMKNREQITPATEKFMEYLPFREIIYEKK